MDIWNTFYGFGSDDWGVKTQDLGGGRHRILYSDGCVEFRLHGLLHREDGPARIYPNGRKIWCAYGKQLWVQEATFASGEDA